MEATDKRLRLSASITQETADSFTYLSVREALTKFRYLAIVIGVEVTAFFVFID